MRGAAGMSPFEERPSLALDRLADRADYAVIGPMDGRTRVANARTHPYAAICYLEPDFRDDYIYAASGFLIFPDVVLTAAHNVYILRPGRTRRAVPPRYRVTPGRNGAGAPPFGTQPAIHLYAPQRFVAASAATYDFGFIKTARPFQGLPGVFRLAALTDVGLQQVRSRRLLHIAGYPCDKPPGDMWEHAERLDRFTPHSLHYSVDTRRGHSGSPVWVRRSSGNQVDAIAVHVAGPTDAERRPYGCAPGTAVAPAGAANRGIRLRSELFPMSSLVALHT